MRVVDIADQIFRNLNEPSDLSIPYIASWLRFGANIGSLNNLVHKNYSLDSSLELVSDNEEIGIEEVSIYEQLFFINYYSRQAKNSLGVGGVDILLEATSDQGTLRFANRNEVSKTWNQMKKDSTEYLNKLLNLYKFNAYSPQSIEGDDVSVKITSSRTYNESIEGRTFE